MKISTLLLSLFAIAAQANADIHTITVYSRAAPGAIDPRFFESQISNPDYRQQIPGYAIIRTERGMPLEEGVSQVRFADVAAGIDPSTVSFKSLTDPDGTHVLDQTYRYDLVSTERILDRYLGSIISIDQVQGDKVETLSGRLMTARGGDLILETPDGRLVSIGAGGNRNIRFPKLPDGLITRPTLEWLVAAERGGMHDVRVAYEALGMTWWADYNAIYSEVRGCQLDFSAWVSLVNQTGAGFRDAKLKLIAGDVHRAPRAAERPAAMEFRTMAAEAPADRGFEEKAFFEYHLYTLGRQVDLPDRSLKQLELFEPVQSVPCRKTLRFSAGLTPRYGGSSPYTSPQFPARPDAGVEVFLGFSNDERHGLGMPLPRGRIRVSQQDPDDGSLEFIGEDTIDHTPRNEEIELKIGDAFDVVGERRQADFRWSKDEQWMNETVEVELRNQKKTPVTIEVRESLFRWTNWEITKATHDHRKLDAFTIAFTVEVPAESEQTIRYVARYTW